MEAGYDKAALLEYMDQVQAVGSQLRRRKDESLNSFQSCKRQYTRIQTKLEELAHRARLQLESAESVQRIAEREYANAVRAAANAEDESEKKAAVLQMQWARAQQAEAAANYDEASAAYAKATGELTQLSRLWAESAPPLESQSRLIEDGAASFSHFVTEGNGALASYIDMMEQAKNALYDAPADGAGSHPGASGSAHTSHPQGGQSAQGSPAQSSASSPAASRTGASGTGKPAVGGAVGGVSPLGWCASHSMTAVHVQENGQKTVSMTIGGAEKSYPCTMSGMAKAYRQARASGDPDMIARTSAMFEIETLRNDLELGAGESGFAQLGGYHGDVKKQDPPGYESHHIPSRATQDEDADLLPTLSITHDDHVLTSSFAGKQGKIYEPAFPDGIPLTNYRESIVQNLKQGGPGYIDSVKCELLDLRRTTGHRYDGGISAFLDAVIDLLSTRGIPRARREKRNEHYKKQSQRK